MRCYSPVLYVEVKKLWGRNWEVTYDGFTTKSKGQRSSADEAGQ
jgi:hypothetical protein